MKNIAYASIVSLLVGIGATTAIAQEAQETVTAIEENGSYVVEVTTRQTVTQRFTIEQIDQTISGLDGTIEGLEAEVDRYRALRDEAVALRSKAQAEIERIAE